MEFNLPKNQVNNMAEYAKLSQNLVGLSHTAFCGIVPLVAVSLWIIFSILNLTPSNILMLELYIKFRR